MFWKPLNLLRDYEVFTIVRKGHFNFSFNFPKKLSKKLLIICKWTEVFHQSQTFKITRPTIHNDFRSPECFFKKLKIGYLFRKIARNRQIIVEFFFCVSTRTPKKRNRPFLGGVSGKEEVATSSQKYEIILHIRQRRVWKNISRQMCFDLDGCFYSFNVARFNNTNRILNKVMQYC